MKKQMYNVKYILSLKFQITRRKERKGEEDRETMSTANTKLVVILIGLVAFHMFFFSDTGKSAHVINRMSYHA